MVKWRFFRLFIDISFFDSWMITVLYTFLMDKNVILEGLTKEIIIKI